MAIQTAGQIIGQHQTTTLQKLKRPHSTECAPLSSQQIKVCAQFKKDFPNLQKVFNAYGADKWDYILDNIPTAVNYQAPTLSQLDGIYGSEGAGKALFVNQLTAYYTMVERSGKPMNQQAADLAARQFVGKYGKQCTPPMLLAYFANYSDFKGTLRDFDTEDIIQQYGKKFIKWWGDKTAQFYKPEEPEKTNDSTLSGKEALIELVAKWLKEGETQDDIKNPEKHGLYKYGAITDEIIEKAMDLAVRTY